MGFRRYGLVIGLAVLIVLCLFSENCSRRKYLDNPPIEIPYEETRQPQPDQGVVYLTKSESKKQAQPVAERSLQVLKIEYGRASYYADKFQGRPTASGEPYDRQKLTAAHRTLPFNTMCRVTNTRNKKSVIVRINDRGPHVAKRIIDLSYEAMRQLDGLAAGEIDVMVEVLK